MRIGIIGTENTHVDQIVEYLNVRESAGETRVVALSGGAGERNDQLRERGRIERVVDSPEDLLGLIDAVIITDRHGGLHREHALPFLAAGMPVWVDKPLACGLADAEAIVAAAREHDAVLTSYSALRWIPDTDALAARAAALGSPQVVVTTGPADPASPYGGIWFYGIHPVDVAMRLIPGEVGEVRVERSADAIVAGAEVGGVRVVVTLVKPGPGGQVPFHGMVTGRTGVAASELTLSEFYVAPGLETFLRMAQTRRPPIDYADLLRPIQFLEAVADACR
jgi:predicted dehydrogenase